MKIAQNIQRTPLVYENKTKSTLIISVFWTDPTTSVLQTNHDTFPPVGTGPNRCPAWTSTADLSAIRNSVSLFSFERGIYAVQIWLIQH